MNSALLFRHGGFGSNSVLEPPHTNTYHDYPYQYHYYHYFYFYVYGYAAACPLKIFAACRRPGMMLLGEPQNQKAAPGSQSPKVTPPEAAAEAEGRGRTANKNESDPKTFRDF